MAATVRFRCACPMHDCLDVTDWFETAQRACIALAQHLLTKHEKSVLRLGYPQVVEAAQAS